MKKKYSDNSARPSKYTNLSRPVIPYTEDQLFDIIERADTPALLLILDGITDPHNLGACIRSAEAAGVQAVIAPKDRSASITDTVRSISAGAAERVPFVRVTNLARTMRELQQENIWIVGTDTEGEKILYETDLVGPTAIVMGSEGKGLRRLTRESCDFLCHIPMPGKIESLNVSVATGVCLFEAVRQRRAKPTR